MAISASTIFVGRVGALSGALLGSAVLFIPNILPLILGYAAKLHDAKPTHLGMLNSAYAGAALIATIVAPFWLPRTRWRQTALAASLLLAVIFALSGAVTDIGTLIVLFGLAGLAAAVVSAPGNGTIGRTALPARWFGVSSLITLGAAAIYAIAAPNLIEPAFGSAAALQAPALFFIVCAMGALFIAKGTQHQEPGGPVVITWSAGTIPQRAGLIASFGALILFAVPAVAYWIFIERIGTGFGLSSRFISLTITTGLVAAAAGPLITAALGRWLLAVCVGGVGLAIVSYSLLLLPGSSSGFFGSFVLFNIAWGIMAPALFSVIRRADFTNRIYVAGGAGILISNTLAGPPAGLIVENFGYTTLIWTCIALSALLAIPLFVALKMGPSAYPHQAIAAAGH